jgi:hypothetical protein
MGRKFKLALVAGAVAAMTAVPAAPASASQICQTGDPLTQRVVCGAYYLATGVMCKVFGPPCAT